MTRQEQIKKLESEWADSPRWKGVERGYSAEDVVKLRGTVQIEHTGWLAIRASGAAHNDQPTGDVFGHTSAVYVEVTDNPANASEDAAYFIQWIDRLRGDIRRRNRVPSRHQVHVESQIAAAREVFNRLLTSEK